MKPPPKKKKNVEMLIHKRAPSSPENKSALSFKFKALYDASLMCVLSRKVNVSLSTLSAGDFHYSASEEPACFLL